MILVDTSVWVDHLRKRDPALVMALEAGQVISHAFIVGELALGNLRNRLKILQSLQNLPQAVSASDEEVLAFVERYALAGVGIGSVDAHLLASARLASARLWTHDKRLCAAAARLGLAYTATGAR